MRNARYLSISTAVLILDQLTKYAITHSRVVEHPVVLVPGFFRLAFGENSGALFGMFSGTPEPWRTLVLFVIPLSAIALLLFFIRAGSDKDQLGLLALALILGGAVGNQVDRVLRAGKVIDFLDAHVEPQPVHGWLVRIFGSSHWPAFNVADSAIVVGAILLGLDLLRQGRGGKH